MQEQGPKTPSPEDQVSAGEEKIFSYEESPIHDLTGPTLESCRTKPDQKPTVGFRGYPETHYKNRTGLRGTHDPSPAIPEQFPLDANFQKP